MDLTFQPQVSLRGAKHKRSFVVVILPCGNKKMNEPIRETVNTTLTAMSSFPTVELKLRKDLETGFVHSGKVVDSVEELARELGEAGAEEVIVLGGVLERGRMIHDLDSFLSALSGRFPGAAFHFMDGATLYYSAEEEDYYINCFIGLGYGRKSGLPEGASRYWRSLNELSVSLFGETAVANLVEDARAYAKRIIPATAAAQGEPFFVISPPPFVPEKICRKSVEEGMCRLRRLSEGFVSEQEVIDREAGELILNDPNVVTSLWMPSRVYADSRIAAVKVLRELGLPVKLLFPKDSIMPGEEEFLDACVKAGATEVVEVEDVHMSIFPWPRNFALQAGSFLVPNHGIPAGLFNKLGIAGDRLLPAQPFGSSGEVLLGEEIALVPAYASGARDKFLGHAKEQLTRAVLEKLGYQCFFLPPPLIDKLNEGTRVREGLPFRVLERVEDLDYRVLLLKKARAIFVGKDYYDRFRGQVTRTLEEIKDRFGYSLHIVEQQFGLDLNIPELPDGSLLVYAGAANLIAALEAAGVRYHKVNYQPAGGDISSGPMGGLRCATNLFFSP